MDHQSLEARIARLEQALERDLLPVGKARLPAKRLPLCFALAVLAAALGFKGLGPPNHPYQVTLGALTIALAYHRRWLMWPAQPAGWVLALLNAFVVATLFKLIIGSGIHHPFSWMRYPELSLQRSQGNWLQVVPDMKVLWLSLPIADWELDLTLMQTFLLLVTLIGALFRFQPFVSFTAFLLILVSLPAFASFDWTWVFPAMTASAIAIYLQSSRWAR